jgi:hypothetical protein
MWHMIPMCWTIHLTSEPNLTPRMIQNIRGVFLLVAATTENADRLVKKKAIIPKIGQNQTYTVAVEGVPDLGKRLVTTGRIERAVVD